jgi:hypothetical protein
MQLRQIVLARRPKGFRLKTSNGTPPFDSESGTKFYILGHGSSRNKDSPISIPVDCIVQDGIFKITGN